MDLTHEALKMAGALALVILVLLVWVGLGPTYAFGETSWKGEREPLMRVLGGSA